ncbi:2962_t:CDS:1, partial [Racocetra persica]
CCSICVVLLRFWEKGDGSIDEGSDSLKVSSKIVGGKVNGVFVYDLR